MIAICDAHSITPIELFYLGKSAKLLTYVMFRRRYLHHIIQKYNNLLIKLAFKDQNENPTKGDFCELVKADMDIIGQIYDENILAGYSKSQFKVRIQKLLNEESFKYLKSLQLKHKKIKDIVYKEYKLDGVGPIDNKPSTD